MNYYIHGKTIALTCKKIQLPKKVCSNEDAYATYIHKTLDVCIRINL